MASTDDFSSADEDRPVRSFFNGTMDVRVYERERSPGSGKVLIFETDFGTREALIYPMDWRHMSDAMLAKFARSVPD